MVDRNGRRSRWRCFISIIITCCTYDVTGCGNCQCAEDPCPPWWVDRDDHIIFDYARGQVSVSSSAAASVKYPPPGAGGAPQAYISSLSSAKADPKIPVTINQPVTVNGNAAGTGEITTAPAEPGSPNEPSKSKGPAPSLPKEPAPLVPPKPKVPSPPKPLAKSPIEEKPKANWGYKASDSSYGPENWAKLAPQCAGQNQSPIDIDTASAKPKPLTNHLTIAMNEGIGGGEAAVVQGKLLNNGKALGFNVDAKATPVKLSGGVLEGTTYTLRQFHIHFGCTDQEGSEHTLDKAAFPGELHFVFTNDKYPEPKTAMQQKDGLAILAFFLRVRPQADPNPALERIAKQTVNVQNPQQQLSFPDGLSLTNLVPAMKEGLNNLRRYVYRGSLPTPPCFESVTWVVFNRPIGMKPERFAQLRKLKGEGGKPLCGNYRKPQPLNGREVFKFTPEAPTEAPAGGTGGTTIAPPATTGVPAPTGGTSAAPAAVAPTGATGTTAAPPTTVKPTTGAPVAPPPV